MTNTLVAALAASGALWPLCRAADIQGDMLKLGRQIYREGRLASGEPVKATVIGDVPVEGTQFTCLHCHRSSGLGSSESRIRVLPAAGLDLFRPRSSGYRIRPAYTDNSLANLLRTGVDPAGAPVNSLMPTYQLPEPEMGALIAYLKSLSSEISPGVTEDSIHIATVVADGADAAQRRAMLQVLETFFRTKNGETRAETHRAQAGPFYMEYKNKAYRKWVLHVWDLRGPESGWREQLEKEYDRQPVFAMLSGISSGGWAPVHRFCEDRQLPCLLPNVDSPPVQTQGDFYSLYFSKGLTLEAAVVAADLVRQDRIDVVQVFRPGSAGAEAAAAFRTAAAKTGRLRVLDQPIKEGTAGLGKVSGGAVVLWLDSAGLASLNVAGSSRLYLSSTLLGGTAAAVPAGMRRTALLVHPYSLSDDLDERSVRERAFFRSQGITMQPNTARVQFQTYFACEILGGGLMHIKRRFHRDYLLDSIDHFQRMAAFTAIYPRLSFGPGQRYLAKGAYIVSVDGSGEELSTSNARWVVPER
jgi:hypothetical protein